MKLQINGVHQAVISHNQGTGDFYKALEGEVPFTIKCVDGTNNFFDVSFGSGYVIYRKQGIHTGGIMDVPGIGGDYQGEPQNVAEKWWDHLVNEFPPELLPYKDKIWCETINEVDKNESLWLGEFCYHTGLLALRDGFNWIGPSWAPGEPEFDDWEEFLPYLRLCAENPNRLGVAIHEYSLTTDSLLENYPYLVGRFEFLHEICDNHNIRRPTIFITEFGWTYNSAPSKDIAMQHILEAGEIYAQHPNIKGALIWCLDKGWGNIGFTVNSYLNPLKDLLLNTNYPDPEPLPQYPETEAEEIMVNEYFVAENGDWYDVNMIQQCRHGWTLETRIGENELWEGDWNHPEALFRWGEFIPEPYLKNEYDYCYKIFASHRAWWVKHTYDTPLDIGKYKIELEYYDDCHVGYIDGEKVPPPDPLSFEVRLSIGDIKTEWITSNFQELNTIIKELEITQPGKVAYEMRGRWGIDHLAVFVHSFKVTKVVEEVIAQGFARIPYDRTYVLYHSTTPIEYVTETQKEAQKEDLYYTVGFSADDAGVGNYVENLEIKSLPNRRIIAVNPDLWGEDGDGLEGFFNMYYNGVQYIPVYANSLSSCINGVINALKYNQPQFPSTEIFSVWPTEFKEITQTFGNNPEYYSQFGLPGHEGLDIKATGGSRLYAICDAIVSRVGDDQLPANQGGHNYGVRVYIKNDPYTIVYAHLQERYVNVGDIVKAGDIIGLADNTGNSFGNHLHLTIKHKSAYEGGSKYIGYPYNIIDPTPLLEHLLETTPEEPRYTGKPVAFKPAIHCPGSDWMWNKPELLDMFNFLDIPVKFMTNGSNKDFWYYAKPDFPFVRVFWQFDGTYKTPEQVWQDVGNDILTFCGFGKIKLELFNEPNLPMEGLFTMWQNGDEFGLWLREFILILKDEVNKVNLTQPELYYPGMSPSGMGVTQYDFANGWKHVDDLCDGLCIHAYSGTTDNVTQAVNEIVNDVLNYREFMTWNHPVIVSECSVNRPASDSYKADVYKNVQTELAKHEGVEAIVWFISDWDAPPEQQHGEKWLGTRIPEFYKS